MNRGTLSLIYPAWVNGHMPHGLYHLQDASCKSKLVSGGCINNCVSACVCFCVRGCETEGSAGAVYEDCSYLN